MNVSIMWYNTNFCLALLCIIEQSCELCILLAFIFLVLLIMVAAFVVFTIWEVNET